MKEGWTYKKLGEVAAIKSGYTPSSADLLDNGVLPYFKVGDMNVEGNEKYLYHTSSFLDATFKSYPQYSIVFPKNGAAIATNKKRILSKPSVVDLNTAVLISDTNSIFPEFLYYWICKIDFRDITRRGAVPTLDVKTLMQLDVPVPSFSEQERVVSELDLLSSIIEKKKEQLKEYDKLAQSIFYDMFGSTNDEKGWEIKKFGEVGTFQRGGGFLKSDFIEEGFPCIHYGQIHTKFGFFTYTNLTSISEELAMSKSRIAHKGDVIIAITSEDVDGSCKSVAWMGDYDVAVGAHAAIFSHNQNPIYVSYYFRSAEYNRAKERYARGFKVVEIKPNDIAKIDIPLPPLPLQQSFAEKIEAIELQKEFIKQSIAETETLFNSRMDYYFN